jgi:hypothetical protein
MELKTVHRDQPHSGRSIWTIVRGELAHRATLVLALGVLFAVAAVVVKTSGAERLLPALKWLFAL